MEVNVPFDDLSKKASRGHLITLLLGSEWGISLLHLR